MELIVNRRTQPAFNLALEEYALTRLRRRAVLLWRNSASVIIGRNQNAVAELDMDYVRAHAIPVIRRQSGGGAVFHDLGNVNFTLIHPMGEHDFSNYEKFTAPICDFLRTLGVEAGLSGRNDLLVDGRKVSGNAQAVRGGWIMHHGTLLFSADLSRLAGALRPGRSKVESKGVRSVRSRVANIADHLPAPMDVEQFFDRLAAYFREHVAAGAYQLTPADIAAVEQLVGEKYGTWQWNFGRSPAYNYTRSHRFAFGAVELCLRVQGGVVAEAALYGDYFGERDIAELEARLCGVPHERAALAQALAPVELQRYIHGITLEQLLDLF